MQAAGMIGAGISAAGSMMQAQGQAASMEAAAAQAERRAYYGKIKALQTDAQYREELGTALANIDAIRAAANTDPYSPTARALKDEESRVSNRNRRTEVFNIMGQVEADKADAQTYMMNARYARMGGIFGALSAGFRAFG